MLYNVTCCTLLTFSQEDFGHRMASLTVLTSILVVCLLPLVLPFPSFQNGIPNGKNVVNPCDKSAWPGVGHRASQGGGPLNPFGADFAAAGNAWTTALCQKDSDGDGVSNGEELGDSRCQWNATNGANLASPKGHPGICEPVGSGKCGNSWFACSA
ncbi:temptin-like isoform X3 [Pomacea canaliculata]|uniref:temptin-like isoform X3 n=1 Tax=Pomacea canaliculata TaxID=400727 RepID=UPI000D73046E|nr:temptin-like isoform X3 [Pomacea canaliculata]